MVVLLARQLRVQGDSGTRVFRLENKTASAVAPMLRQVLPNDAQVTLRAGSNEVVVSSASPGTIDYAAQFIRAVDRRLADAAAPVTNVRTYACPSLQQDEQIKRLRARFGGRPEFRISGDSERSQIYVIASPMVHALIEQQLQPKTSSESPRPSLAEAQPLERENQQAPVVRFRSQQEPPRGSRRQAASTETRFIPIRSDLARLQSQLSAILGARLQQSTGSGRPLFVLTSAGQHDCETRIRFATWRRPVDCRTRGHFSV